MELCAEGFGHGSFWVYIYIYVSIILPILSQINLVYDIHCTKNNMYYNIYIYISYYGNVKCIHVRPK